MNTLKLVSSFLSLAVGVCAILNWMPLMALVNILVGIKNLKSYFNP